VIKKFWSLFTSKSDKTSVRDNSFGKEMGDIIAFVDYVVRALVDEPELVKIEVKENENRAKIININCKKADIGKIIGKNGKTIMAIRSLVTGAASRINQQVAVEVVDNIAD
jgi:uncharacterized protein